MVFFSLLSSKKTWSKANILKVLISAISEQLKAEKQTGFSDKMTVNYQYWMRDLCVQEQFWQNPQQAVAWLVNKGWFLFWMGQALFRTASPQGWLIFLCVLRGKFLRESNGLGGKISSFFSCVITTVSRQKGSPTFFNASLSVSWHSEISALCCMRLRIYHGISLACAGQILMERDGSVWDPHLNLCLVLQKLEV